MLSPTATIELVYMDESGSTSAVVVNVPITSSIATMDAQASALASLIAPMTDCVLVRIRYNYKAKFVVDISDAGSTPIVVTGMFFFTCAGDAPDAVLALPSFKPEFLVHIGPTSEYGIDTTASEVIALFDELIAINAVNPFGDTITAIDAAYRQSRV